jgi:peptidoglycan/xylan/chitin deacetylase (PgdA/CDA1 family)
MSAQPSAGTGPLVLCYHAVSETWPAALSVTPAALEEQLSRLVRAGYRGMTFAEAAGAQHGSRTLVVTFDDAFASVFWLARPILRELGLRATVFLPTRKGLGEVPMSWPGIDEWAGGPHGGELAGMTPDQLEQLAGDAWEVGSHSRTHPRLSALGDAELEEELRGSREDCERLGFECRTLAYPYGDADDRVRRAAERAGYAAAAGLSPDLGDASRYYWPRVGVYHSDDMRRFRLKTARVGRRLRSSAGWRALAARRAGGRA